ncbi:hypothetical protein DSLASN_13570 [Desulfoluna limicola]|uniref:Glycoside hydrolase family 5 domain-containing protein n=2 Tax=Desulfoluna limicola TaxID=2810562 RepID=A0ABM7PEK4_9BACT|nr:hypothetical protein DSLASN_13570 [Desulfoluna limicola]
MAGTVDKFQLWDTPGYFKGFNAGYWSSHDDHEKTTQDILDLKATGANLVKINIYGGTVDWKPPYGEIKEARQWLHRMIEMAREAGLYYIIDVRAGPGRRDVSDEDQNTIWTSKAEQKKYAHMLVGYVRRYGDDPLFVGLNLMVEPNPLWKEVEDDTIESPQELKQALHERGMDIHGMFHFFITEIRKVHSKLPLIVQNIEYSDPQWWGLMEKYADPRIVYDVHSYVPVGYSHAERPYKRTYPGRYWCRALGEDALFNRELLEQVVFKEVTLFQKTHGIPILLGEFGMEFPQAGGEAYLSDHVDIAKKEGWHFCLWSYRSNDPESRRHINFDPEKWNESYWMEVKSWFQ